MMNHWIAACLAILIAISLAGAIGEEASAVQSEGNQDVQYEERSHIRIRGDQDLEEDPIESQLPGYEGPDNGVRSGSGTEDDPFVIERWRIEYTGAGSGVWVEATTHHLVIRDLQIWSDAPEGKQGHAIVVYAANNVELERIEFDGLFLPFLISGDDIQIRDMEIPLGNIKVEYSRRVLIEDIHMEGTEVGLGLVQSQGVVRDIFVNQTTDDGRRHRDGGNKIVGGVGISDGRDCVEGNSPSHWRFDNVRVISFEEYTTLWLACDITVEVTDSLFQGSKYGVYLESEEPTFIAQRSTFSGNEHGILVGEDASCHCRITESNFFQNEVHIENNGNRTVEAVDNWWGSPDGPAEGSIVGPVEYEPWLDEGEGIDVRESPATLLFAMVLAIVVFVSHRREKPPKFKVRQNRPIIFLLVMVVFSTTVAGCLGGDDAQDACRNSNYLESVSPTGADTRGNSSSSVPVKLGRELILQVHDDSCPADSYRWKVMDTMAAKRMQFENVEPGNYSFDPEPESRDEGGYGMWVFDTSNNIAQIEIPHLGDFWVLVNLLDEEHNVNKWGPFGITVRVRHVVEDDLPTDGSVWSTSFSSICCPYLSEVQITQNGSGIDGGSWTARYVVERTGEVIWEGEPGRWPVNTFSDSLGWQWQEIIRFELEPREPGHLPGVSYPQKVEYEILGVGEPGQVDRK